MDNNIKLYEYKKSGKKKIWLLVDEPFSFEEIAH